jgi:flagellar motor switch protein FliN/FliY
MPIQDPSTTIQSKPIQLPSDDGAHFESRSESASASVRQAESALTAIEQALTSPQFFRFQWEELSEPEQSLEAIDSLADTESDVPIKIVLGKTHLSHAEMESLHRGSVIVLDKRTGDSVEVYAANRLIARGEIMVHNQRFCIRVTEVL